MLAFARVALIRLVRDRTNLFFLVVFPLLLVLLLGLAFGGEAGQRTVGLVVAPDRAAAVGAALEDEGLRIEVLDDRVGAVEAVADGAVVAAVDTTVEPAAWLVAPGGAARDLELRVERALGAAAVDERAAAALAALGVADGTAAVAAVDVGGGDVTTTTVGAGEGLAAEFAGLGRFDLGASQQLLLFVFITSLTGSVAVVQARRWRVVDRVLTGPSSTTAVLGGLALGQLVLAAVQSVVIVLGSSVLFDVRWGDPLATGAVVLLFALVATAAGLLLASLVDNEDQVAGIGVPVSLALAALGGSMLPLELFPDPLLRVANLTPHAWGNRAFAEIVRRDGGLADVLPELGVLLLFAVALGAASALLLRRRIATA